jgi:hypothetical protein
VHSDNQPAKHNNIKQSNAGTWTWFTFLARHASLITLVVGHSAGPIFLEYYNIMKKQILLQTAHARGMKVFRGHRYLYHSSNNNNMLLGYFEGWVPKPGR